MMSIFKTVFSEKNIVILSISSPLWLIFNQLWRLWWSLYLLEIGAPIAVVGLLSTIQNTSRLLFQLPGGMLSDRFGRKTVLVIGSFCRVLSAILLFFGRTWQELIPGILADAVSGVAMPAANAMISESIPTEGRGASFGVYRAISRAPQIFMPVISGIYIDQMGVVPGVRTGLLMFAGGATASFLLRAIFLKETLRKKAAQKVEITIEKKGIKEVFSQLTNLRGTVLALLVVACIGGFAGRMVYPFLAVYAVNLLELTTVQWGLLETIFAAISTVLLMFGGLVSDKMGSRVPFIILARLIAPIEYIGLLLIHNFNGLILLFIFLGIGGGLGGGGIRGGGFQGGPAWSALIADSTRAEERGKIWGLMGTITGLVSMPASIVGAYLWEISPSLLLIIGLSIGLSVIPLIFFFVKEPEKKEE